MFYKNLICLVIGLIIGVRLTDFWDYVRLQSLYAGGEGGGGADGESMIAVDVQESPLLRQLRRTTRVLCWIMTTPENHAKRALHVERTWGRRCDRLLFMSTRNDGRLGAAVVALNVSEGRAFLWRKTREAFKFVYERHYDEADWFLKADDDTYVIMENLRAFLSQYSARAPVYFGSRFHPFVRQGYMSGGAGYVLSKEALRRFALLAYPNPRLCSQNTRSEDKEMGICLQNVGVAAGDSRDVDGRERFMPLAPGHLIPQDSSEWYGAYLYYRRAENASCCSRSAISFHYIKPKEFYVLEYLLYELSAFGVHDSARERLPAKADMSVALERWRHEMSDNVFRN